MSKSHTGGCQCGYIRYSLDGDAIGLFVCHCRDCQTESGSAFGMSLIIPEENFHLTSGKLKTFEVESDSGRIKTCAFCPDCGVRIHNTTSLMRSIKAGTLDETSWLHPGAHYWTKSKQQWITLPENVPCYADDN